MKKVERLHNTQCLKDCKNDESNVKKHVSVATGGGAVAASIGCSGDQIHHNESEFVMPKSLYVAEKNIDDSALNFEKDIVVQKAPKIDLNPLPNKTLSDDDVVTHVKSEYQQRAKNLLKELSSYPTQFSYDSNGLK